MSSEFISGAADQDVCDRVYKGNGSGGVAMSSEIDENAFMYAMSKHNSKTFTDSSECFQHFVQCYESARAPRTISVEELNAAIDAYWQKHPYQQAGGAYSQQESMARALATLGITVMK